MRPLGFRLALAAALLAARSLPAQAAPDRFAVVRDSISAMLTRGNLASITVAVARGDSILWTEGFGFANREKQVRATPETMYSLASISKPFTATGIMRLAERGRIEIDRPINDYLGSAKVRSYHGSANDVTVRRVLSHSAGLPLHYQFFYEGITKAHTVDDAITRYGFAGYAPGETYFYSNLGFGILGHVGARLTGTTYESFMEREVFAPLGLRNTIVSSGAGLGDRAAIRYDNQLTPIPPYDFDHAGGSAVWSSANDLVRFGMLHAQPKKAHPFLSSATRERMQRPEAPETGPGASYGLGWGLLENDRGYRRVSHTGGMPGVTTVLNLYPSEGVVIVVLANTAGAPVGGIATMIASVMLPGYGARQPNSASPPSRAAVDNLPGAWAGSVMVGGNRVPLSLAISAPDTARARIATGPELLVAGMNVNLRTGWVSGRIAQPLRAPDATPATDSARVFVTLSLRQHGDTLSGWASSITIGQPLFGAVSYPVELVRAR